MKKLLSLIITILMFFLLACSSDSGGDDPSEQTKEYSGKLEKGAFQKGAEIIAYGWNGSTGFTGESFATTTSDNLGTYSFKSSKIKDLLYVKAEGFYFNENSGVISDSTLKLYAIIDSTKIPWNINVLTHIIKDRVIYLIEHGVTYDSAVNQSITELFANFNWTAINPGTISIATNPQLLFLSAAICKDRSVSEVSALLTTLCSDLADGNIDISILDESFYNVDITEVQNNMTAMYGTCPTLSAVKSDLLTFRSISAPVKTYIVSPVPDADMYYFTDSGGLKSIIETDGISNINMSVIIKQDGKADINQNITLSEFFKIGSTLYFSANFDGADYCMSQTAGVISFISALPEKPIKSRITMDNGIFSIKTVTWDIYTLSDVRNESLSGGIFRGQLCNTYHIGQYKEHPDGIYFVMRNYIDLVVPLPSGLYYLPKTWSSNKEIVCDEAGDLW